SSRHFVDDNGSCARSVRDEMHAWPDRRRLTRVAGPTTIDTRHSRASIQRSRERVMSEPNRIEPPRIEAPHPYTRFADEEIEQSIPERFEQQVRAHPRRLAVRSPERSFTYQQLNRTANRLARTILSLRCGDADVVAL